MKSKLSKSELAIRWRNENPARYNAYFVEKRKTDINFKIAHYLRKRTTKALKSLKAIQNLGCSIPELKSYLESKWQPGMTWENYGKRGWHIDHVKPLNSFDLQDSEQLKEACNYTNLQPLWAIDNFRKGDRGGA